MAELYTWLTGLIEFPQLSFVGYIIAGILTLVIVDAFLNLLFSGMKRLVTGR